MWYEKQIELCYLSCYLVFEVVKLITQFTGSCVNFHTCYCRFDVEKYHSKGVGVIAWTVNSATDKDHFENILHIPYMTDYILRP